MTLLRKADAQLLEYVLQSVRSPLADSVRPELASWLAERRRFVALLSANRDKIRKKLGSAAGDAALLDVRAELLVAALLSADPRFEVAFEAYGAGRRGPDLAVVFRRNQRFNVEVTRLRSQTAEDGSSEMRLARAIAAKLAQLKPGMPNVVALVGDSVVPAETVSGAVRTLKGRAGHRDTALQPPGGPLYKPDERDAPNIRALHALYARLSAVASVAEPGGELWISPDARHPLPRPAAVALSRCFAG